MEYKKIISVTGLPGLYELINSKNDGALVRSLDDKNTRFVSSRIHHFSNLESIEVFTTRDNVNLADVFNLMAASSESVPVDKDNSEIRKYFETVFPDMDFERVYASDMKKMVKWFDILRKNNIEIKLSEEESETNEEESVESEVATTTKEPISSETAPTINKQAPLSEPKAAKSAVEEDANKVVAPESKASDVESAKPKKATRKKEPSAESSPEEIPEKKAKKKKE